MRYLLDTNVLIEASRLHYAADIVPGFWTWLAEPSLADRVGSSGGPERTRLVEMAAHPLAIS